MRRPSKRTYCTGVYTPSRRNVQTVTSVDVVVDVTATNPNDCDIILSEIDNILRRKRLNLSVHVMGCGELMPVDKTDEGYKWPDVNIEQMMSFREVEKLLCKIHPSSFNRIPLYIFIGSKSVTKIKPHGKRIWLFPENSTEETMRLYTMKSYEHHAASAAICCYRMI